MSAVNPVPPEVLAERVRVATTYVEPRMTIRQARVLLGLASKETRKIERKMARKPFVPEPGKIHFDEHRLATIRELIALLQEVAR